MPVAFSFRYPTCLSCWICLTLSVTGPQERHKSMTWLAAQRNHHLRLFGDKVHDLGTFVENHGLCLLLFQSY